MFHYDRSQSLSNLALEERRPCRLIVDQPSAPDQLERLEDGSAEAMVLERAQDAPQQRCLPCLTWVCLVDS